jgi:FMN phosphatase YigB (HAD superfamily)
VAPSEVKHIGDNIVTDVDGPAKLGINTRLFDRNDFSFEKYEKV